MTLHNLHWSCPAARITGRKDGPFGLPVQSAFQGANFASSFMKMRRFRCRLFRHQDSWVSCCGADTELNGNEKTLKFCGPVDGHA
ncbi:MAG: hypothetical protein ACI86S_000224 [Paracoccaceae bacterium]|jgi:hypothetical protein